MKFRSIKILALVSFLASAAFAQNPSKWSLSTEPSSGAVKNGSHVAAELKAEIEDGWHLYALDQPKGGPIPTTIKIFEGSPFTIVGDISAPVPTKKSDANFVVDGKPLETKFYEHEVFLSLRAASANDSSI